MGLLPHSASLRARRGFISLHLPGSSAWHFRKAPEPALSARCLQTACTSWAGALCLRPMEGYQKGHCCLTPSGTFPPTPVRKRSKEHHRPQDVHDKHLHTSLPFTFTLPYSPFILHSFAGAPDLRWALSPQLNLNEQHQNQCHCPGFTSVKKQRSLFLEFAWLSVLFLPPAMQALGAQPSGPAHCTCAACTADPPLGPVLWDGAGTS